MFAAGANAFLGVGDPRRLPRRPLLSKKNRDELVHASVGKEEIRGVGEKRRRRHDGVVFLAKAI
jgi:hypothetical protein